MSSAIYDSEFTEITNGILQLNNILPIFSEWQADTNANLIPWSFSDPSNSNNLDSLNLSVTPVPISSNYK